MENSIFKSTKKILGLPVDDPAFDLTIITHINSTLQIASELGIGPEEFHIEDETPVWADLGVTQDVLNLLRNYVFLKVKMLFDPPTMGFLIDANNRQIAEHEWRLARKAEALIPLPVPQPVRPVSTSLQEETPTW